MHVKFSGLSGGNPTCMWELQTAVSIPSTSIRHSMEGNWKKFLIGAMHDLILAVFSGIFRSRAILT